MQNAESKEGNYKLVVNPIVILSKVKKKQSIEFETQKYQRRFALSLSIGVEDES